MTDEMPFDIIGKFCSLGNKLGGLVFAEDALAKTVGGKNIFSGVPLGDGTELNRSVQLIFDILIYLFLKHVTIITPCYNQVMSKPSNFLERHGRFLLALALILGLTSFIMTILSQVLERGARTPEDKPGEYWLEKEETHVVNVLAGGALLPSSTDGEQAFDGLGQLVENYDYAAVAYHSLVGTDSSPAFADQVCQHGFNLIGLAYPGVHASGKEAIDRSMDYWNHSSVRFSGTYSSTDEKNQLRVFETNGISVIYLSYTDRLDDPLPDNEAYLVNVYSDEKTPAFVSRAAEQADVVIVSIAWDGEPGALPNDRQKQIANALSDAGASIVIGYADNAVQPACWIDDTLVFYSLGNLYTESEELTDRIGALGAVTVTKTTYGKQQRIELTNPKMDLVLSDPANKNVRFFSRTDDAVEDSAAFYEGYVQVLQQMDDSIRIGGLK